MQLGELIKNNKFITEAHMEQYLINNMDLIEPNLRFLTKQMRIGDGILDIAAIDENGVICAIELKNNSNDGRLVEQCLNYYNVMGGLGRIISISPKYTIDTVQSLQGLIPSVEIKIIEIENEIVKIRDLQPDDYNGFSHNEIIIAEEQPTKIKHSHKNTYDINNEKGNIVDENGKIIIPAEKLANAIIKHLLPSVIRNMDSKE